MTGIQVRSSSNRAQLYLLEEGNSLKRKKTPAHTFLAVVLKNQFGVHGKGYKLTYDALQMASSKNVI